MFRTFLVIMLLSSSSAFADAKVIKITVKGMVCAFCAQGVIKKFKAEKTISKVDVSLEKQMVTLDLKEGQDLDDKKIKEIIYYAGYDLVKIERPK